MGLNHISIAAVIALLGTASALHAETAPSAVNTPEDATQTTPHGDDDPALKASPIAGTTPASPSPSTPKANVPAEQTPVAAPGEEPPAETKGDVLKMPKAPAAKKKKASSTPADITEDGMPGRGASMPQVEKHFGKPLKKLAPVGNPPITRWVYRDYTVYFEREFVIHSVKNDVSGEPASPAKTKAPIPPAQPTSTPSTAPAETPPAQPSQQTPASPETAPAPTSAAPEAPATKTTGTESPSATDSEGKPASGQ